MVDDNASDPTQEESQQKACESLILHDTVSFRLCDNLRLEKQKGAYNRSSTHRKTQTPIVVTQTNRKRFRTPKSAELAFLPVPYLGVAKKAWFPLSEKASRIRLFACVTSTVYHTFSVFARCFGKIQTKIPREPFGFAGNSMYGHRPYSFRP